jgi:pilus assembly protein CpaF
LEQIRKYIIEQMDMTREITDEEIIEMIDIQICERARVSPMSTEERRELQRQVFFSLRRLDILQELLEDDSITEIMVNGASKVFYEKEGRIYLWDKQFTSNEKLDDIIQQIVSGNNRAVNEFSPIVDTRLADGSRINVVLSPIAIDGSCISIRKFPHNPISIQDMLAFGSVGAVVAEFLKKLVQARYNIFISGGTGSGKTTFLNVLSCFIPAHERVITIEDSAELQIQGVPNLVRLETRNANVETGKEITARDLIKTALRMRPDRIIIGEIRGSEALEMLQSMNTGHDGSLSTGHSNGCEDMLSRIETMVLMGMDLPISAVRSQISSGIDIMVHLGRLRDRSRKVLDVMEVENYVQGEIHLHSLFRFKEEKVQNGKIAGYWEKTGELIHKEKLLAAGFYGEYL